tara:strand:- start:624 stop:1505 length:882 start_codon:yes stop_codon:yes gene_type:complete
MIVKTKNNFKFFKQFIYYCLRFLSEKHIKTEAPLAGLSFDAILHHINIFGTYEKVELEVLNNFIKSRIKNPSTALDIGANIGNHSVRLFSKLFSHVHCFEPNEKSFELLKINVNDLSNVTIHNIGLSNKSDDLSFKEIKTNMGSSKIDLKDYDGDKNSNPNVSLKKIKVKELDSFLDTIKGRIDFIKIDVEGHELEALQGAKKTIRKFNPIIGFEENHVKKNGYSKVMDFLKNKGYTFYTIKENFDFGEGKLFVLLKYFFQDIFGTKLELIKTTKLKNKNYYLIIGINEKIND